MLQNNLKWLNYKWNINWSLYLYIVYLYIKYRGVFRSNVIQACFSEIHSGDVKLNQDNKLVTHPLHLSLCQSPWQMRISSSSPPDERQEGISLVCVCVCGWLDESVGVCPPLPCHMQVKYALWSRGLTDDLLSSSFRCSVYCEKVRAHVPLH